jgi:hypothetical protein
MPDGRNDKPRKIVICHPDNVRRIQSGLVESGITDVLVKPDPHGIVGLEESYVMDPLPDIITGAEMRSLQTTWREAMGDFGEAP